MRGEQSSIPSLNQGKCRRAENQFDAPVSVECTESEPTPVYCNRIKNLTSSQKTHKQNVARNIGLGPPSPARTRARRNAR